MILHNSLWDWITYVFLCPILNDYLRIIIHGNKWFFMVLHNERIYLILHKSAVYSKIAVIIMHDFI